MTAELTTTIKRYGSEQPLPTRQTLHAGPVEVVLEGGDLRYIRLGSSEIVRRLYMAVRDQNWGTIEPVYTSFAVQDHGASFQVDFTAEHVSGDVDFAWTGQIDGANDGTITYTLDGAPRKTFLRNRIGFCVLHPSDLAGTEASVETPDGPVEGLFPLLISPHQPFVDMQSITHPIGESAHATITFAGDLFEMEDQRNWTDASYKTYGTPLRLPYPVEVDPSTRIHQTVTIAVSGVMPPVAGATEDAEGWVRVDLGNMTPFPPVGFGSGLPGTITSGDLERLRRLAPAHLWVSLDLGGAQWRDDLMIAAERATALAAPLDLSVVAGPGDGGWDALAQVIAAETIPVGRVYVFPAADDPITFPRSDLATHDTTIAAAKRAFEGAEIDCLIGGGTLAYFTEFNRAQDFLPVDQMDVATYTINPQVHAFDNLSVIECISAQASTVESARAISGDTPLIVGPVTLRPPFNPNATRPVAEPAEELPFAVDPRQLSLLGAGWTVGSLHRLAEAGVDGMTFYELYGWRGLIERERDLTHRDRFPSTPGQLFPLFHVFAAAAPFAGGSVCAVEVSDPFRVEALALRNGDAVRLMIANLAETEETIRLTVNGLTGITIEYLDETTYTEAMTDPGFSGRKSHPAMTMGDTLPLPLKPFAVAFIDATM